MSKVYSAPTLRKGVASSEEGVGTQLGITMGRGRRHPQGKVFPLPQDDLIKSLADTIGAWTGEDAWFALATFRGNYRRKAGWLCAAGVCLDVDYHDRHGKHAPMPLSVREEVAESGGLVGNLAYFTPRGLRLIWAFAEGPAEEVGQWSAAVDGAIDCAREAFNRTGILATRDGDIWRPGLVIDEKASRDRARCFWTPSATVDGVERASPVRELNPNAVPIVSLIPRPREDTGGVYGAQFHHDVGATPDAHAALERECDAVAVAGEGHRNVALNRAAFNLGQRAADGELDEATAMRALFAAGVRAGLSDSEVASTAKSGFQAGQKNRRSVRDRHRGVGLTTRADGTVKARRPNAATVLVSMASQEAELIRCDDEAFATVPVGDHRETYAIPSRRMSAWLRARFLDAENRAPGKQSVDDAMATIQALALRDGGDIPVGVRLLGHGGRIFLDLGSPDWSVVEVSADGWRVSNNPPVRFTRTPSTRALPVPVPGGSLASLRTFVPVSDEEWPLLVGWLLATLHPSGPYPVLALEGEAGSAKSTTGKVMRKLIDPVTALLRAPPRSEDDLLVAARQGHVVAIDNLSGLPDWLSDAFCRLSTGSGLSKRKLWTDGEEYVFEARRPIILIGIDQLATRGDLADRTIRVTLCEVPEARRRTEGDLFQAFERERPLILGALLDAAASALRGMAERITIRALPRMADATAWITAAEAGLGLSDGAFVTAYAAQRMSASDEIIEGDSFATALLGLPPSWEGRATDLLSVVGRARDRTWPQNPRAVSQRLRRLAPDLRRLGVHVVMPKGRTGHARKRIISISRIETMPAPDGPHGPQHETTK